MQELKYVLIAVVTIIITFTASLHYRDKEDRKAYYACLQLSEKLAEQQLQPDSNVRYVTLPHCTIRK